MDDSPLPPRSPAAVDFPIERVEAQHVARREFSKFLVVVSGGLCAGSGWVAVKETLAPHKALDADVRLCALADVPADGMKEVTLPDGEPAIVVHHADGTLRLFEQKCTHLSCAVFYDAAEKRIVCPCHSGAFDATTGAVLQGPPPRPLRSFAIAVRDGGVWLLAHGENAGAVT